MRKIVISQKIKEYRSQKKVTQKELAKLLGVSCQSISKWEREECYPDISLLPLIAECIGCPVDDFFAYNHIKNSSISCKTTAESNQTVTLGIFL